MMAQMQLLIILLCMSLDAFFAGMETGVISIHRMRLQHRVRQGARGARALQGFLDNPDRLFGTTLVGTNLCVVCVSVAAASLGSGLAGAAGESAAAAISVLMILVFDEYLPKAWFRAAPLEHSLRFVRWLEFFEKALTPLSRSVLWLSRRLVPGPSDRLATARPAVTRDDLKLLARESETAGAFSPRERFMIHRVFELSGKRAGDIMIPRDGMAMAETTMSVDDFLNLARQNEFTRLPLYDRAADRFVGILNVFTVLAGVRADPAKPLTAYARPPMTARRDAAVDDLLPRMRRAKQPMCLVADDSGRVVGLLTMEDILEEIVGEL